MGGFVLSKPFLRLFCMVFARVGTTPRTAYSASLTQGLISVQKKLLLFTEKLAITRSNISAKLVIIKQKTYGQALMLCAVHLHWSFWIAFFFGKGRNSDEDTSSRLEVRGRGRFENQVISTYWRVGEYQPA